MAHTTFRHGDPVMVDYTPASGNIAAGEVKLLGNTTGLTCLIAHVPITNNTKGAMAAGGGVYDVVNLNNAADGAKVYWDASTNKVTSVSTNMATFGFIVPGWGGLGANSTARALHKPYV
jgi:hypothetical protein